MGIQITCFLLKSILEEIRDVETLVLVQVLTFFSTGVKAYCMCLNQV